MELPALQPEHRAAVRLAARLARARITGDLHVIDPTDVYEVAQAIEALDDGVTILIDPDTLAILEIAVDGQPLDTAIVLQAAAYLALALAVAGGQASGQRPDQVLDGLIGAVDIVRVDA